MVCASGRTVAGDLSGLEKAGQMTASPELTRRVSVVAANGRATRLLFVLLLSLVAGRPADAAIEYVSERLPRWPVEGQPVYLHHTIHNTGPAAVPVQPVWFWNSAAQDPDETPPVKLEKWVDKGWQPVEIEAMQRGTPE